MEIAKRFYIIRVQTYMKKSNIKYYKGTDETVSKEINKMLSKEWRDNLIDDNFAFIEISKRDYLDTDLEEFALFVCPF